MNSATGYSGRMAIARLGQGRNGGDYRDPGAGARMNVIELARRADVAPSVVRFYARSGVIAPHPLPDGRVEYDESDAARLALLVRLHRLGVRDPERLVVAGDALPSDLAEGLRQLAEEPRDASGGEGGAEVTRTATATTDAHGIRRTVVGSYAIDAETSAEVRRVLAAIASVPDVSVRARTPGETARRGSWIYGSDASFIGTVEAASPSLLRVRTHSQLAHVYYVPRTAVIGQLGDGREVFIDRAFDAMPAEWLASPAVREREERERRH